ncbi:MAG: FtsQ-type POTRA domain-containing protein [Gemmatimonadetes bacterium]|nr:FtsQ-type POTRA domain-containing protein [Gemmatimonadota bacterium]
MRRKRKPWLRWLLLASLVGKLGASAVITPRVLRAVEAFRVRRVALVGTRYLGAEVAVAVSGITAESSVFDNPEPWRERLLRHPLVADVRIERQLPGTLVLEVKEVQPVALLATPELRAVDGAGNLLPIDAAAAALDLPVLLAQGAYGARRRLSDGGTRSALATLERLSRLEPGLAARVSEAHARADGGVRLLFRPPLEADALLPPAADATRFQQLRLALADLRARGELERVRRIDLRFRDQVVVSLDPGLGN